FTHSFPRLRVAVQRGDASRQATNNTLASGRASCQRPGRGFLNSADYTTLDTPRRKHVAVDGASPLFSQALLTWIVKGVDYGMRNRFVSWHVCLLFLCLGQGVRAQQ